MFIVHLPDGQTLTETSGITWDKIPDGIDILEIVTFGGETITLPQCESYFFSNEAQSFLPLTDYIPKPNSLITAKIIGGIIGDKALYIRIDTQGHIQIEWKNKKDLPFANFVYKKSCQH